MTAIKPGDIVRTTSGRVYTVSHVGPKVYSLAPLAGSSTHRHAAVARNVSLVRSAELERFHLLIRRARDYLLNRDDVASARAMLVQSSAWLTRAHVRHDDDGGDLNYARQVLKLNVEQVRRAVTA